MGSGPELSRAQLAKRVLGPVGVLSFSRRHFQDACLRAALKCAFPCAQEAGADLGFATSGLSHVAMFKRTVSARHLLAQ